jgi:hypothetical protein
LGAVDLRGWDASYHIPHCAVASGLSSATVEEVASFTPQPGREWLFRVVWSFGRCCDTAISITFRKCYVAAFTQKERAPVFDEERRSSADVNGSRRGSTHACLQSERSAIAEGEEGSAEGGRGQVRHGFAGAEKAVAENAASKAHACGRSRAARPASCGTVDGREAIVDARPAALGSGCSRHYSIEMDFVALQPVLPRIHASMSTSSETQHFS